MRPSARWGGPGYPGRHRSRARFVSRRHRMSFQNASLSVADPNNGRARPEAVVNRFPRIRGSRRQRCIEEISVRHPMVRLCPTLHDGGGANRVRIGASLTAHHSWTAASASFILHTVRVGVYLTPDRGIGNSVSSVVALRHGIPEGGTE